MVSELWLMFWQGSLKGFPIIGHLFKVMFSKRTHKKTLFIHCSCFFFFFMKVGLFILYHGHLIFHISKHFCCIATFQAPILVSCFPVRVSFFLGENSIYSGWRVSDSEEKMITISLPWQ